MHNYWQAARHPWPCLLFVLPLLFLYEGSMLWQAMNLQTPARAGMDGWLSSALHSYGLTAEYLPSLLIAVICISWAVLKWDRSPPDSFGIWAGIAMESIIYSLALWSLGMIVTSALSHLSLSPHASRAMAYLGSGIFEEILFRLVGFGSLCWLFGLVFDDRKAFILALLVSSLGFAAAHHLGPHGESWQLRTFLFRALAGGCFACLFHFRGLGVAVGTHSAYNVIVGLAA
jgi:membrane protease YdiL (CAAX protease family)